MKLYDFFPVMKNAPLPGADFYHSYWRDMSVVRANVSDAEVPAHPSPLSLKAVLSGRELYAFGRREAEVNPDTCLITPANSRYASLVPAGRHTRSVSVQFPNQLVELTLAAMSNSEAALDQEGASLEDLSDLPPCAQRVAGGWRDCIRTLACEEDATKVEDVALQILGEVLRTLLAAKGAMDGIPATRATVRKELFRRACRARDAMDAAPHHPWTTEELGRCACVSPFHLRRVFQAAWGVTPMEYLRDRRVSQARELLATTRLPVGEIALQVGFENFSAFSRSFRQLTGLTPSAVRHAQV